MTHPAQTVAVMAVDDNELVLDALERGIGRAPGFRWVGATTDVEQAVGLAIAHRPDVLLLDFNFPGKDVVPVLRELRKKCPATAALMFSGSTDAAHIERALEAGAIGFIIKDSRISEIMAFITSALEGRLTLSPTARAARAGAWID